MTNTNLDLVRFVQPQELNTPKLSPEERNALWTTLNLAVAQHNLNLALEALGVDVRELGPQGAFVACGYPKQTDAAPREEGKDYQRLPGVSSKSHFGSLTSVFRRKADQAVRFRVWSVPRQNFTTVIPDGLEGFAVQPRPEHESRKQD
jgi:hypothetical protein